MSSTALSAAALRFRPARLLIAVAVPAILLAGCDGKARDDNGAETASIHFGDTGNAAAGGAPDKALSIDVPGFSAKLAVPGLDLGGKDTDIDGIPLYPGTKVTGVNINATAAPAAPDRNGDRSGGGRVDMAFSVPTPPATVLDYYRTTARTAGWHEQAPAAGQQFVATKADDDGKITHLALALTGAPTGSTGRFTIDGD